MIDVFAPCLLCGKRGGVMEYKRMQEGWVHLTCPEENPKEEPTQETGNDSQAPEGTR